MRLIYILDPCSLIRTNAIHMSSRCASQVQIDRPSMFNHFITNNENGHDHEIGMLPFSPFARAEVFDTVNVANISNMQQVCIHGSLHQLLLSSENESIESYISLCEKSKEIRSSEYAKYVQQCIINAGLENHKVLGNLLVLTFVQSGSLVDARRLFNNLNYKTERSWTCLIQAYVECGQSQEAFDLFKKMQVEPTHSNKYAITSTLKACTRLKYVEQGNLMHSKIIEEGLEVDSIIGNTLVDMYSKQNLMDDAQRLFDKLTFRDVVSWNALIAGYAEQKLGEELENCLLTMRLEGVSPDPVTFLCILKTLEGRESMDKGREMHAEVVKRGFERTFFVANNIVHLYLKFGLPDEAREVLDKMPERNVVSWTALITGYTNCGLAEDALSCLESMKKDSVSPNSATYICTLQACINIGCSVIGQKLHSDTIKMGFERDNTAVGNILVDMYIKFGFLIEAQNVFDKLLKRDVISWTSLLAGYAENGRCQESLMCMDMMEIECVFPNATTFLCSLKACDIAGNLEKGLEIYAEVVKEGLEGDLFIGNTLIDMYGSCGLLIEAREVFDEMPVRNIISWNILIAGYAEHGDAKDTTKCLKEMESEGVSPNATTLICSLKACGYSSALGRGREIHIQVMKEGFDSDLFFGNSFVDMYVKCDLLVEAQNVFNTLKDRDVVSWTSLIAGYADCGLTEEVFDCFNIMMLKESIAPNASTFANVLKACRASGAINRGLEMHTMVNIAGFERDPFVASMLVDMYAIHGSLEEAQDVFDHLHVKNLVSWTALISGYANHGSNENALINLELMQMYGIFPDATAYVCIVKACGNLGAIDTAQDIHISLIKVGLIGNATLCMENRSRVCELDCTESILCNALVDMYSKCGKMADARNVFETTSEQNLVVWNALISGYALQGEPELALLLFHQMKGAGVRPDAVTYVSILTACNHVGLVNKGILYIEEMTKVYDIHPNLEHYNCIIDVVARAGQLINAIIMSIAIPLQPDVVTWITILGACRKWSDTEIGRHAFEYVVSLDEKHLAAFVLMSNIYLDTHV